MANRGGKRRTEFASPLNEACSAGDPVPDAVNANRPREPPASCVCSRMSRFFRHSPPNLIVCLFISFVSDPTTFQVRSDRSHGWLAEKPSSGSPNGPLPPLMLICEIPLVYWSRFAPGMPTSVLVVRPSPVVIVVLR